MIKFWLAQFAAGALLILGAIVLFIAVCVVISIVEDVKERRKKK